MALLQAFTVVNRATGRPFTLQVRDRPAVMSFSTHRNACYVALAIEHRASLAIPPSDPYTLVSLAKETDEDPSNHYLRAYEDFASLLEECKLCKSDAMFITGLETPPDDSIQFYGELFCTD